METYIKGNFKKAIYKTEKGFIVGLFKVKDTNQEELEFYRNHTIPFTGYFHELNEEDTYLFYGKLVEHEKYGEQFQVESYERVLPEEKEAIVDFLSSGLFKGIGEKTAKNIVDYFGKDTFSILLEEPNNLLHVPSVSKRQIGILHDTLVEYESSYKTVLELNELGFSTKDSLIIYNKYKAKTDTVIEENIYQLTDEIEEISFRKVDAIFLKQENAKRDDTRRILGAILYVMKEVCNLYGHSCLEKEEIFAYVIRALGNEIGQNDFDLAIERGMEQGKVIEKDHLYYLKELYEAELNIAKRCGYLMRKEDKIEKKIERTIQEVSAFFGCVYNEQQKEAIEKSFTKNILIVTGGPGTGKTTIIHAICETYKQLNNLSHDALVKEIALLAPTGRASKRISEATQLPALTIHRFLKWNKENNKFAVNEFAKSDAKVVIVDEFSMVDTLLFDHLLKGLRYDTKLILVGDYNQLPSVGTGQLLKDMIESEKLNIVRLKELYRQQENSNIISLAYQINEDCLDTTVFNRDDDLIFLPVPSTNLKNKILEVSQEQTKEESFQVLAPMYKTINGIDNLNLALQEVFNPKAKNKKEMIINGVLFREQDKVIQLTNMPEDNVFNGDIGYIETIENGTKKEIVINFDGNFVRYTSANFQKFKHAYAISIHKSQGSEFDTVILPIVKGYGKMLYRKLIYTAVTRCKKKLYVIGEIEALEYAIQNNDSLERRTTLKTRIIENLN